MSARFPASATSFTGPAEVSVELAFLQARELARLPLPLDLKEFVGVLGRLRRFARSADVTKTERREADAMAEHMAQRVLNGVRGEFGLPLTARSREP